MASLNLAGKTSGYVKLTAPDDSSNNPTVTLPTESGELALKSDITGGGGSGGGVEAQPPVAFRLNLTGSLPLTHNTKTKVVFDSASLDTDNGFMTEGYKVQKDGIYNLSYVSKGTGGSGNLNYFKGILCVNDVAISTSQDDLATNQGTGVSATGSCVTELKKDDVVTLEVQISTKDGTAGTLQGGIDNGFTSLSGHMVSSFTEGSGDSATLDSLGIPNHDKITVGASGKVTTNGEIEVTKNIALQKPDGETTSNLNFIDKDRNLLGNITSDATSMVIEGRSSTPLRFFANGAERMKITDDDVTVRPTFFLKTTSDYSNAPNMVLSDTGQVRKSTAVMYTAEETETAIDKKLAIKDKLIEKLEARLDALEKKLKK